MTRWHLIWKLNCLNSGLGRVPDLWVWVQVWVLEICMSTSTSTSTWLLHRVRVRVLGDEYEYEYWSMIYILYKQQYCVFQSLKRESSDSNKPGTKLPLPIVHLNSLCRYICLAILCNLVQWQFNLCVAMYCLLWLTFTTCCQFNKAFRERQHPSAPRSVNE